MVAAIDGPFPRAKLSNATHRRRIAPVDEKLQNGYRGRHRSHSNVSRVLTRARRKERKCPICYLTGLI